MPCAATNKDPVELATSLGWPLPAPRPAPFLPAPPGPRSVPGRAKQLRSSRGGSWRLYVSLQELSSKPAATCTWLLRLPVHSQCQLPRLFILPQTRLLLHYSHSSLTHPAGRGLGDENLIFYDVRSSLTAGRGTPVPSICVGGACMSSGAKNSIYQRAGQVEAFDEKSRLSSKCLMLADPDRDTASSVQTHIAAS